MSVTAYIMQQQCCRSERIILRPQDVVVFHVTIVTIRWVDDNSQQMVVGCVQTDHDIAIIYYFQYVKQDDRQNKINDGDHYACFDLEKACDNKDYQYCIKYFPKQNNLFVRMLKTERRN